jgi:hypothetical protein
MNQDTDRPRAQRSVRGDGLAAVAIALVALALIALVVVMLV